jgi:aryl-alcohol dehydrogenase-like predicted oxidoreductase
MAVMAREAYLKGALFQMGEEAGLCDRGALACAALKWVLAQEGVTAVMVGVDQAGQLDEAVAVLDDPELGERDLELLDKVRQTTAYRAYEARKRRQFGYEEGGA